MEVEKLVVGIPGNSANPARCWLKLTAPNTPKLTGLGGGFCCAVPSASEHACTTQILQIRLTRRFIMQHEKYKSQYSNLNFSRRKSLSETTTYLARADGNRKESVPTSNDGNTSILIPVQPQWRLFQGKIQKLYYRTRAMLGKI